LPVANFIRADLTRLRSPHSGKTPFAVAIPYGALDDASPTIAPLTRINT
jgi:hypothetical protein